jgi:hypothetical protein
MAMPAWVSEVGITAQTFIALMAVSGEKIRAALFTPTLQLEFVNVLGERTTLHAVYGTVTLPSGGEAQVGESFPVHHFHVRVTNPSRVAAHEVQVLVTRLEIRGPDDQPQTFYDAAHLPLQWRLQEIYGQIRTIGRVTMADASLLFVRAESLKITVMLPPNNFPNTWAGKLERQHFWLTLVARGLESESKPLRLRVDWDGRWAESAHEMRQYFMITPA